MRRWVKVAAWAAVFLACAGTGAYVAAHTDPFPPGVDRQGQSLFPTVSPTISPTPEPPVWAGSFRSVTYHDLYVGGRCTTRWNGNLRFVVDDAGKISGTGSARLDGKLECDFPIAQTQIQRFGLAVSGRILEGGMAIRLSQASIDPTNGHDFGAFGPVLPIRMLLATHHGTVHENIHRQGVDEQGRGLYSWSTLFDLHAISG
ncbi:MAG: hypothetical protein ACXVEI_01175 [Actinomycetota bacterium]